MGSKTLRHVVIGSSHEVAFLLTTGTIQRYLGHKSIQHTVRYTELAPTRLKGLWGD